MARVYISSTYEDLKEHREAVERALRKVSGIEISRMEDYVADDARPLDKCLRDVRSCDVYVGIIAWRYGYVPENDNPERKSITEREYLEAKDKKRLIFLLDEDADWKLKYTDSHTGDGGGGKEIERFRDELSKDKTCSFFNTPDKLAALVTAAVSNVVQAPPPSVKPEITHFRELQHALLLAYSQYDEALAQKLQPALGLGRDKSILLSPTALFARSETDFESLEATMVRSGAGLLLLTPKSLNQVKGQLADIERVVAAMRARMGALGAVLVGVQPQDVPFGMAPADCFEMAEANINTSPAADPAFAALKAWVDASTPPFGAKVLGLPISVLAMNQTEATELFTTPDFIRTNLGEPVQAQFDEILRHLGVDAATLMQRYRNGREEWQPFAPAEGEIRSFFRKITEDLNRRSPPRLRQKQVKLQWYPFDVLKEMNVGPSPLRRVYQAVADAGCVLVVDELSLFHPALHEAFFSSPFLNKEQVAIVIMSPADPTRSPLSQAIESSLRKQLAGVFQRYADDLDPQCEVAIGDQRRLLRWLYASMPEAIANLRDPQPNRERIKNFFDGTLGSDARSSGGDYLWAGGARS